MAEVNLQTTPSPRPPTARSASVKAQVKGKLRSRRAWRRSIWSGGDVYILANYLEMHQPTSERRRYSRHQGRRLPGVVLHGKVEEIAPASGSQNALPPDNATGNFTKGRAANTSEDCAGSGAPAARQVTVRAVHGSDDPFLREVLGQEFECGGPLNLEYSSCISVAIDAHCVRNSRFSYHDPSDIGYFRRAVWGDDLKMRRTSSARWRTWCARRFAPRCGQCLLAGYGVQCRDDVHRSSLCLSGLFGVRRVPLDVWGPVHDHQHPAAIFWSRSCWRCWCLGSYGGDILPTHAVYCSAQLRHEVCTAGDRGVRHGRCHYIEHRNFTRSLVHESLVMALIFWNSAALTPVMVVFLFTLASLRGRCQNLRGQPKPTWQGFSMLASDLRCCI